MRRGTSDEMNRRLCAVADTIPEVAGAAAMYQDLLPLLEEADLHPAPVPISPDAAEERLRRGVPLLRGVCPGFDLDAARHLMLAIARRLEAHGVDGAAEVRKALEDPDVDLASLFSSFFTGAGPPAGSALPGAAADPVLVSMIARDALKPALRAWRRRLEPLVENGPRWERGFCWACGAPAAFAELQGKELARHLRCGLCGADWPFPRIRCTLCGNEDHTALGILYSEPCIDQARAEYCDLCGGYIKVIVAFEPTPAELIAVEDLATLRLDGIAQRRGYARLTAPVPAP